MLHKVGLVLTLVILASAPMGCGTSTDPGGDDMYSSLLENPSEVVLDYGEEVSVGGSILRVAFGQVLSDSRCPTDVVCVWEGNAEVEIGVRAGMGPTIPQRLNTSRDPRFVDWQGIRITLLELDPAPKSDKAIAAEDYSVRLRFEPLS